MSGPSIAREPVRLIANYLPQFHPTPENDRFWGPGFTEWTNVAKARPLFPGHYQPHVPADLGFYDLRVPEVREQQAEMARAAGIEAFCYWHYWFGNGRMILERPLQEVSRSGRPDFPFCVGWANESWTGIWHGAANRTLIEQAYPGERDWIAHFEYLLPMFFDPRYLRVEGKPLFLLFKPMQLPDRERFADCWRELAVKRGLPGLHLVAYEQDHWPPAEHGFDAATWAHQSIMKWVYRDAHARAAERSAQGLPVHVYDYAEAVPWMHGDRCPVPPSDDHYPSIVCGWDNSPRSGAAATILHGYHPELFRRQARQVMRCVLHKPWEHRLVFVKSWNEWAEGNYLEPEVRFGRAYLEVLREEVDALRDPLAPPPFPREWDARDVQPPSFRVGDAVTGADAAVSSLVARVREAGRFDDALLLQRDADRIDARGLSRVIAGAEAARRSDRAPLRVLDDGGVLNDPRLHDLVAPACRQLVLVGVTGEPVVYGERAAYLARDVFDSLANGTTFDLAISRAAENARQLGARVASGGRLLLAVPCPDPIAVALEARGLADAGFDVESVAYLRVPGVGWLATSAGDPALARASTDRVEALWILRATRG